MRQSAIEWKILFLDRFGSIWRRFCIYRGLTMIVKDDSGPKFNDESNGNGFEALNRCFEAIHGDFQMLLRAFFFNLKVLNLRSYRSYPVVIDY